MENEKTWLENSRDSWLESAKHDKRQAMASFVIAASGAFMAGEGTMLALDGRPVGILLAGGGALLSAGFGRMGKQELTGAMRTQAQAGVRQYQIEQLEGS
ncbi:hypothetical protein HY441_01825 [Candidatus Microgenomates bacterium]|nr:hypothetical protein [Candidatus Microgenomates bacterium]